jgi:deoxynucleoside triphosphate triphosphohydrolase SAMHD1
MLFDCMLKENPQIIIKPGSSEATFVRCLIEGKHEDCPSEKKFLFDIVNNSRNSIDVDKIDYI